MGRHGLYNDDWFNLGRLLALNYNKNWDDRGTKKGIALHDAMMNNPDPSDEDMKTAFDAERSKLMQNPSGLTNMIPKEYRINPGDNASDNSAPNGLTSLVPQEYRVKPAEATPDAASGGLLSGMFPKSVEKQPQGIFSEFLQNQPDRANAIRVATTPDESTVRELAAQQAKVRNDENFNSEEHLAKLNKALIQQGLSPESREAVMKQATVEASAKQRGLYEQKSDGLLTEYNSLMKNGNYTEASALLPQIMKYNQPAAQILYGGGVTPKELYKTDEQNKLSDTEFARKLKLGEINFDRQVNLAQLNRVLANASYEDKIKIQQKYGGNIGGKGNTNQGYGDYSKTQIDQANKVLNHAAKYSQDNYGDMSKYPYQKELKEANRIQSYILSGGQQNFQQSPTMPDELKGFISRLTPSSTSKDILAAYHKDEQIQEFLANNPQYIEWFENQTGLVFPRKNAPKNNNSNSSFVAQSTTRQDGQGYWSD